MDQSYSGFGNDDSDESYSDGEVTSDDEQGFTEPYRQQDCNNDDKDDIIDDDDDAERARMRRKQMNQIVPSTGPQAQRAEPSAEPDFACTFTFKNFSQLSEEEQYSETFAYEEQQWYMTIRQGNNKGHGVLVVALIFYEGTRDPKAKQAIAARLTLVDAVDDTGEKSYNKYFNFGFSTEQQRLERHLAPSDAFVEPDQTVLDENDNIYVKLELWRLEGEDRERWLPYNSKENTGYVGFDNQGATCYMNSLLQTLYHLTEFRRTVYAIPTEDVEAVVSQSDGKRSIVLALQRVFFSLQNQSRAVSTRELTQAFGWDGMEAFEQHDVQELCRLMFDKLEEKMKCSKLETALADMFKGEMENYIDCINIDYQSLREEEYYDISLTVKGMKNIYAAFEKWIEVELMDGENMYEADGHGKQDAKMGKRFLSFPPVLHVHLNRFEYDFERDMSVKVNDRLEFPEALDLNKYIHVKNAAEAEAAEAEAAESVKTLSSLVDYPDKSEEKPEAAPSEEQSAAEPPAPEESRIDYDYVLHSVLIHGGDVHAGHYYVYVRHAPGSKWFKFDDDEVREVDDERWKQDGYGGEIETGVRRGFPKRSNAYMLVYVRKDWLAQCSPCAEVLPPDHLHRRKERELQLQKEHEEEVRIAHMYAEVQVAQLSSGSSQVAQHHSGNFAAASELYKRRQLIPIKWNEVPMERHKRDMPVKLLSPEDVPLPEGHVWTHWLFHYSHHHNQEILQCIPMGLTFTLVMEQMKLEPLLKLVAIPISARDYEKAINQDQNSHLLIYSIFTHDDSNSRNDFGPLQPLVIQKEHTIEEVLNFLFSPQLKVPDLTVAKRQSIHSCKVLTGSDLQEPVSKNFMPGEILYIMEEDEVSLHSTRCNILQDYLNQVEVTAFNKADFPSGYPSSASPPSIQCVLNVTMSHDQVCAAICECLGAGNDANPNHPGPEYMQLRAPAYGYNRHPVPDQLPLLRTAWSTLEAALRLPTQGDTMIFYEFLEHPIMQVEASTYVDVEWLDTVTSVNPVNLRMLLPKDSSLQDVEIWIRNPELSKVTLSDTRGKLRYYSYFAGNSTVDKLLIRPNTMLEMIDRHALLVAELVPPDDLYYYQPRQEGEVRPGRLLEVNHVWKNKQGPFAFGMPLLVAYKENETVAHVMARLQLRLKVEDREWSRWNPARVKKDAVLHEEVEMNDLLDEVLGGFVGTEAWRFGLVHEGSSRRRVRPHIGRSSSLRID